MARNRDIPHDRHASTLHQNAFWVSVHAERVDGPKVCAANNPVIVRPIHNITGTRPPGYREKGVDGKGKRPENEIELKIREQMGANQEPKRKSKPIFFARIDKAGIGVTLKA